MRVAFGVAIAICALALAACGGSANDSPTPTPARLSFLDIPSGKTPNESPTPTPGTTRTYRVTGLIGVATQPAPTDEVDSVGNVLMFRLVRAGLSHIAITRPDESDVTLDFTGNRSETFVKQVLEAHGLNFREPVLSASGEVMCKSTDGVELSVEASSIQQVTDNSGMKFASCTASNGSNGAVEWQPATANVDGEDKALTQSMIDRSGVEIESTRQQGKILLLLFTTEGDAVFSALIRKLVSYPLGIFIDDHLLSDPTVQGQVSGGNSEIAGASDDELALAFAILMGGELPQPVSVTSIALNSPAP